MTLSEIIATIEDLKIQVDALRPIKPEQERRILQKIRLDWNYHSNALEGNTLSQGETRAFLMHGITANGKPFKDYLEIKGHNETIDYLLTFVANDSTLTEAHIRELHKILLVEPYTVDAVTLDGQPTKKQITLGKYKTTPNHVETSTGAIHYYASPEETPARMGDLMQWYRAEAEKAELHPLILAATFHYQFVSIHPFDDGNGRMARLLMNLLLMQSGYVPVIVRTENKSEYLLALEKADDDDLGAFISLIGEGLVQSLKLYLRGARGEDIEELSDLDKRLALLQKRLESEGSIGSIVKSVEQQQVGLTNLVGPLFKRMLTIIPKFEIFFDRSQYNMVLHRDNKSQTFSSKQDIIKKLSAISKQDEDLSQIRFYSILADFIKDSSFRIELWLSAKFGRYKIELDYEVNTSKQQAKSKNLTTTSYGQTYTPEEIDALAKVIADQIYTLIEEKTQQ